MSNVVQILPEALSNKIAAGEIVSRPASVVKELVENSIDANSKKITIEITKGGKSLIRISDDGIGMQKNDAILALDRYATSKIKTEKDLFSIKTLGFRGEAIPSIASVSEFTITTKKTDTNIGTKIKVLGGNILDVSSFGTPNGTMVTVKNLFYNTPVRKKFLKSQNTEMSHIIDTITSIALAKPYIKFRFIHNGKILKDWRTTNGLTARINNVLGNNISQKMFQIKAQNKDISLKGYIANPQINRTSTKNIYFFINGRWTKNKLMHQSLLAAYKGLLIKGKYPIAVIFVRVPHDHVDINVHPTKQEVRFASPNRIHKILYEASKKVLNNLNKLRWNNPTNYLASTSNNTFRIYPTIKHSRYTSDRLEKKNSSKKIKKNSSYNSEYPNLFVRRGLLQQKNKEIFSEITANIYSKKKNKQQHHLWKTQFFSNLIVIGQFQQTYLLCESKNTMIIVDQHAAHERIIFEKLKSNAKKKITPCQKLLIPELVEMNFSNAKILQKLIPILDPYGFKIENFGNNSFIIKSIPSIMNSHKIGPMITKLTDKISIIGSKIGIETIIHECLSVIACHNALKAKQNLNNLEIKNLMSQLDSCKEPSHCPHGRPIWIELELSRLKKKFSRIK